MQVIKNLCFEGGGILAIAYGGFLKELKDHGFLDNLEKVSGVSAGAITAGLLSIGYTPEEIYDVIFHTDFSTFEDHKNPARLLTKYGIYKGDAFLEWFRDKIARKNFAVADTFADLDRFNLPKLNVYAVNLNTKSIQHFCFDKTPDIPIAEAIRASMSIPGFFEAYRFENDKMNGHLFVDGGVMLNYPLQCFDNKGVNPETLGVMLGHLTQTPPPSNFGYNQPLEWVKDIFDCLLNAQNSALLQRPQDMARTVTIDTLGISATNFGASETEKRNLYTSGRLTALDLIKKNK